MNNNDLKVGLITGASRRIGRAISLKLANNGYLVAIHYNKSQAEATELAEEINNIHGEKRAITIHADILDNEALLAIPEAVVKEFGRIDLLVNNASLFNKTDIEDVTDDDIALLHRTHVSAPFLLSMECAKWLKLGGNGRIVNIVDIYADFAKKGFLPYTISKAGLKALTRQLAVELAPEILVNGVAPGAILPPESGSTESAELILGKIPLQKFGRPEDIADAVLFLSEAEYITGQTIVIDGGRSLRI